jgi:hypothetical protein
LTDLIADLRRVVTDSSVPGRTAQLAAAQLARLAAAGVAGAHPRDWYGLADRSSENPPVPDGTPVTVSPSAVESLTMCALRGILERRGARGGSSQQQIEGIVVHALVDGLAKGVARADLVGEMERFLSLQTQLPPWLLERTRRALEAMLTAAERWIADLPADRRLAGSEVRLDVAVPPDGVSDYQSAARPVRLAGRADRLDRAPDGSLIVVDFKTGATVPSKAAVAENAQLAVYQLALELGAADGLAEGLPGASIYPGSPEDTPEEPYDGEPPPDEAISDGGAPARSFADGPRSGGAELVFLRTGTPNVRRQPALAPDAAVQWRRTVRDAAQRLASSVSTAQENRYCERCPVRTSCPLQPEGRQVTR